MPSIPLFKYLPESWTRAIGKSLGAITLARMQTPRGLDGAPMRAELHSIVMDPASMQKNKMALEKNLKKISMLAKNRNIRLIALGALLPSVSRYGQNFTKLQEISGDYPFVTTGHVCTAWCIQAIFKKLALSRHSHLAGLKVGVLGAAGSTGSLASKMLHRLRKTTSDTFIIHLVDKNYRRASVLKSEIGERCTVSDRIDSLKDCDYIIVVTNASSIVLRPVHVKKGAVIIDDTQPRATSKELQSKAYVVDVLAQVKGLDAGFDFGFRTADKQITFSCLAEMIILAAVNHDGNFAIGPRANLGDPDIIEIFLEYMARAARAGVVVEPVTKISFSEEITDEDHAALLSPQGIRNAAE